MRGPLHGVKIVEFAALGPAPMGADNPDLARARSRGGRSARGAGRRRLSGLAARAASASAAARVAAVLVVAAPVAVVRGSAFPESPGHPGPGRTQGAAESGRLHRPPSPGWLQH